MSDRLRCGYLRIDPAENGWLVTLSSYESSTAYVFQRWDDAMAFIASLDVRVMIRPYNPDGMPTSGAPGLMR